MPAGTRADMLLATTSYARTDHGGGVVSWRYRYWNPQPIEHVGIATSIELGVQIEGSWLHHGSLLGKRIFPAKTIHRLNTGEHFRVSFHGGATRGLQVGFALYLDEIPELRGLASGLCLRGDRGVVDRDLYEVSEWLAHRRADDTADAPQVRAAVVEYLRRHAEIPPPDPLLAAKRELELHFDRELLVAHIAEVAGMHPVTFSRKFRARFGATPAHYRLGWRLHSAGRLLWSRPDLTIREVAERSGFNDLSFFHRLFRERFALSPSAWRRERVAA